MSHIFTYSKESFSDTSDPKERVLTIHSERGMTKSFVPAKNASRVRIYLGKDHVTVPRSYILRCKIDKWLNR